MKLEGRAGIHTPRPRVWAFVTDPGAIAGCVPAVQSIETLGGGRFRAHAVARLAFFSVKAVIDVEFIEIHEPDDATVLARGHASGSAVDATATMVLTDGPDGGTVIDWSADVTVSGMIASMGAGAMDEAATTAIGQVFDCVKARLEA
jgi:carbon monoxide dehydrogenase subunit G